MKKFVCTLLFVPALLRAESPSKKITYFLEARFGTTEKARSIRINPSDKSESIYVLAPGDLLKREVDEQEYAQLIDRERKNTGAWVPVKSSEGSLYAYTVWTQYRTIDLVEQPIDLAVNTDSDEKVITIFSEPGHISWRDCVGRDSLCVGWPNRSAHLTLLETEFHKTSGRWELLYKVAFRYDTESHGVREGIGWTSSRVLKLKSRDLSVYTNLAKWVGEQSDGDNSPVVSRDKVREIIAQTERQTIVKLGLADAPAADVAKADSSSTSTLDLLGFTFKVDLNFFSAFDYLSLNHGGPLPLQLDQGGMLFGIAGAAPILLDYEVGGLASYTIPIERASEADPQVTDFRFEQYVVRRVRSLLPKASLRLGLGWHVEYFGGGTNYGYSALVGGELVALSTVDRVSSYLKIGPVLDSDGPDIKNFEAALGGGWLFYRTSGNDGWSLTGDIWQSQFTAKLNGALTTATSFSLGLRRTL